MPTDKLIRAKSYFHFQHWRIDTFFSAQRTDNGNFVIIIILLNSLNLEISPLFRKASPFSCILQHFQIFCCFSLLSSTCDWLPVLSPPVSRSSYWWSLYIHFFSLIPSLVIFLYSYFEHVYTIWACSFPFCLFTSKLYLISSFLIISPSRDSQHIPKNLFITCTLIAYFCFIVRLIYYYWYKECFHRLLFYDSWEHLHFISVESTTQVFKRFFS